MYTSNDDRSALLHAVATASARTHAEMTALRGLFTELTGSDGRKKKTPAEQTKKPFDVTIKGW